MRRSWLHRAVGGLIGIWFALAVPGIASIPMADGGDTAMAGMADMPGVDHHGMAPCAQAAAGRPVPAAPGGSVPAKHQHHGGCDGACCTPATVTLVAGRLAAIPVVPVRVVVNAARPRRDVPRPVAPQVILPPPLGPPAVSA